MTSADSNYSGSVPNLPEEVWTKIFSHLHCRDRKSVRLTCHQFYDACNTRAINANEELFFTNKINAEIIGALCNSERSLWNITLDSLDLSDYGIVETILPFFQQQGHNIRSLTLFNCCLKSGRCRPLPRIIELCESLHAFNLHNNSQHCEKENMDSVTLDCFEGLQKNQIIRETVTHLTVDGLTCGNLTNKQLQAIFAIFPNVDRLEIGADVDLDFGSFSTNTAEVTSSHKLTFSCVHHELLKMRDQLKALKLYFTYRNHRRHQLSSECFHTLADMDVKNLEKLSFSARVCWDAYLANSFSKLKNLTEIECFVGDVLGTSKSEFVTLLLSTLTELRSLKLTTDDTDGFIMNKECFQALVRCRLATFKFYDYAVGSLVYDYSIFYPVDQTLLRSARMWADFEPSSLENHLLPNYTLKHIRVKYVDQDLPLLFSTYFRAVDSLIVPEVRADILENILEHQSNLRYLKLSDSTEVNTLREWSRNRGPSLSRRLDQLVHLHIVDKNLSSNLLEFLLDEFVFPRLKSLTVEFVYEHYVKVHIEPLVQLLPKVTQLEHLEVRCSLSNEDEDAAILPFERWLAPIFEVVSKMNLQYFSYYSVNQTSFEIHEKQCFQWLDMCPSLRIILAKGTSKCVRDPITKKITVSRPAFHGDTSIDRGFPNEYCTKLYEIFG